MIRHIRLPLPVSGGLLKKRLLPILLTGVLLASAIPLRHYIARGSNVLPANQMPPPPPDHLLEGVSFALYSNDSLAELDVCGYQYSAQELDSMLMPTYAVEILSENYYSCIKVLFDSMIYTQRWDTLSQPRFWRRIMTMDNDSCLVSLARDRSVIDEIPLWQWDALGEKGQVAYRDSMRQVLGLPANAGIYVTAGKNHYYKFERVLPTIGTALSAFRGEGVDPWYAQAILLIESPGAMHRSPVGAYGAFQLMPEVAREHGLIVSDTLDERENFVKSAQAAAHHIQDRCVRPIRNYLRMYDLDFQESDLWFRMLVLHAYHAGPGNVASVLEVIQPEQGGVDLMQKVWTTEAAGFKNASQNYSQLALASMLEVDHIMRFLPDTICHEDMEVYALGDTTIQTISPDSIAEVVTAP